MEEGKRSRLSWLHVIPVLLAGIVLVVLCMNSKQSRMAMALPNTIRGEYSQDGGPWLPLEGDTELSALAGDVTIRGSFSIDVPEGVKMYFYLDHIGLSIYRNGELLMKSSMEEPFDAAMCGTSWYDIESPGITAQDDLEIHLHNPHWFGNRTAYDKLLRSIYCTDESALWHMLEHRTLLWQGMGVLLAISALVILGIALSFFILKNSFAGELANLGLSALFAGLYIAWDTMDVSFWSPMVALNTNLKCICLMLAFFELGLYTLHGMEGRSHRVGSIAMAAEGAVICVICLLSLFGVIRLYDGLCGWMAMQLVVSPVLIGCALSRIRAWSAQERLSRIACVLVLLTFLADLVNCYFAWWPQGIVTKLSFLLLFLIHLVQAIRLFPRSYQAVGQVKQLQGDLKNSSIVLASSQIRAHFIFNVLNAISGMCKYDPEKADETVIRFSRYLRTNISIMQDDKLEPFQEALRHLEDYVALEQIRFGNKVGFTKDIQVDSFLIPPLVLQPIVENAIKHGLNLRPQGGTVTLKTWSQDGSILIRIQDDGVGFDPAILEETTGVGISNVRFRLANMARGTLAVVPTPGVGTTVTITLPCKEE